MEQLTADPTSHTRPTPAHLLEVAPGQVLAVDEYGSSDPDAPVVLFLHSSPGSRVLDPDGNATIAAGVRLLTIDRPGYGASTPWPEGTLPTIAEGTEQIAAAVSQLGIRRLAVVGWSAGGRLAVALAALHPELVSKVALVGTPAPDDDVPWINEQQRQLGQIMRADPSQAMATISSVFGQAQPGGGSGDAEGDMLAMVAEGTVDEVLLEQHPELRTKVLDMLVECFAQGPAGIAADIVADYVAPWDFDLADVEAPVTCFYADQDPTVPPVHGAWYASRVPHATERLIEGKGHLLVLTEWADILASVSDD